MERWEYSVCTARLETAETDRSDFKAVIQGEAVWGLANILNRFGRDGWERVSCLPGNWNGEDSAPEGTGVTRVLAVLKRAQSERTMQYDQPRSPEMLQRFGVEVPHPQPATPQPPGAAEAQ